MTWVAPTVLGPLHSDVVVPGSKSATARSLVLAALSDTPSVIRRGLRARDTSLMIQGLRSLGALIDDHREDYWEVTPITHDRGDVAIDCGLAGTVMRFLPPLAVISGQKVSFFGDDASTARPISPLLTALQGLGAITEGSSLPFSVQGPITGRAVTLDSSASSQFISGLLLSAPRFPSGIAIHHHGGPLPSQPHIDMTIHALSARGASLTYGDNWWVVAPTPLQGITEVIEPDLTTAAVFLAAAVVCGGSVTIKDWPTSSIQPGIRVLDIFEQLGASVTRAETHVSVTGTGTVSGIDIDLSATSELTPLLVGLALFAEGDTRIRGVGHIRGHETNRLSAIATEITALGGYCTETSDGLIIRPAPLGSGIFHSYGDHRMAHLGALIGARIPGITIDDIECTTKTMPGFAHTWQEMFP